MKVKITKKLIDSITATDETGPILIWDTEQQGFGVRCWHTGGKIFQVKTRVNGKARWFNVGRYGKITVEKARQKAASVLGSIADGEDPAEIREADRKAITVEDLCKLYLKEGCATKKASTLVSDRGRIARHIIPLLGDKRVKDVTRGDIERFVQSVATGKTAKDEKTGKRGRAIVTGGKGTATRTVGLLGGIFTFAVGREFRTDNPVQGVKRFKDKKCERFLSEAELGKLGEALRSAEEEGENKAAIDAIRLLMLTGCRKNEVLTLRWQDVDFEWGCLRLPDSKTGAKIVPIGKAALDLMEGLSKVEGNDYVFASNKEGMHLVGLYKVWERVKEAAELEGVRLHDLRHSFASVGAASGDSLLMIGALLGHKDAKTTARYAHLSDNPIKQAADRIAGVIAGAMLK
ncbi:MAG: site-specific integrase [Alphaproteobacteria bacterium]|nr:site-specific integrase [Alphaproteobacteria bacterium]